MKLSKLSTLLAILPLVTQVSASVFPRQDLQENGNNNNGDGDAGNNDDGGSNDGDNSGDPQTSLTLDPRVIASGFANDGQDVPAQGQVASLTSTNNFINFCLTVPNLPITNGQQIRSGSCNPAPIGVIPSTDQMPSSKFTFPQNGATIPSDEAFTISMAIQNLETGNFVNAEGNYFAAPQQLNGQGTIIGHSHVVVEQLDSLGQVTPTDPNKFAFFKGLNNVAQGGILTADVTKGLPAGAYRLCSINAAANHQPVIVPIAQHGSLDDCVYFTASPGGTAEGDNDDGNSGATDETGARTGNNGGSEADTGADSGASDDDTGAGSSGGDLEANDGADSGAQNNGTDTTNNDSSSGIEDGPDSGNDSSNGGQDDGNTGDQEGDGQNRNGDAGRRRRFLFIREH